MPALRRVRAVLGFKRRDAVVVLARSKAIHHGLSEHPALFVAPSPSLPFFLSQIEDLDDAQTEVATRVNGAAANRDTKRDALWTTLELLLKYVQSLADSASSPEKAIVIVQSAALEVAGTSTYQKSHLEVRQSQPGAPVELSAYVRLLTAGKGARQVSFNWRYTLNGGESWVQVPSTPVGNTAIAGLPRTEVGFQVSVSDAEGTDPWSQTVTFDVR